MVKKHNAYNHLKWRMITQDGLTPEQADKRIELMKEWEKKSKIKENKIRRKIEDE